MPAILSKFVRVGFGLSGATALFLLYIQWGQKFTASKKKENEDVHFVEVTSKRGSGKKSTAINATFFSEMSFLLKILFPSVFSPETAYALLVGASMIARTYCDVWMIANSTAIERSIITRDLQSFKANLMRLVSVMLPISLINQLLKYGLNEMSLRFRNRLTQYLYSRYLNGYTYYRLGNLDNRISNPDQLLTADVDKFCTSVTDLYSNLSKPILDIIIYANKLTGTIGLQGPTTMLSYLALSGFFLTMMRRPISKYTVVEQQLEGHFRFVNSRLITNSEEIAFYNGNKKEGSVLNGAFARLVDHLRKSMQFRFTMGVIDNIIAKYVATVVGFYVVSRPFLDPTNVRVNSMSHSEMLEDYYKSGRMLLNLATAVGRLVLAGRELTRLSGFTSRVVELINVLDDINKGKYERTMVNSNQPANPNGPKFVANSGTYIEKDNIIVFENVPLVTPNGDVLINSLNFTVDSGVNVLVHGPNGCGKSSLFRVLGQLWPLWGGRVTKPAQSKLFYVPQRPYMTLGTLRDQIIYPHTKDIMLKNGKTDADLELLMKDVKLEYLLTRGKGWDAVEDWMDVLSGGEKQRIAMARLFYHRPQFAILDECTSAVSIDVEHSIYTHCRSLGITLFTISHRKTLWKYHEMVLEFKRSKSVEFKTMETFTKEQQDFLKNGGGDANEEREQDRT